MRLIDGAYWVVFSGPYLSFQYVHPARRQARGSGQIGQAG
jgi:hypothetical protein